MEVRALKPEEWGVLAEAPDGLVLDNRWVTAVVALEGGKLVGRMYLCLMPHIEGTWVSENHRHGSVAFRVEKEMEKVAKGLGIGIILAYSGPEHERYLERLGFEKAQVTVWSKRLEE